MNTYSHHSRRPHDTYVAMKLARSVGHGFGCCRKRPDQILATKRQNPGADTSGLEAEIDRQVYALYGLTPAEIKLVEESSRK
jgi:hypothetical protein